MGVLKKRTPEGGTLELEDGATIEQALATLELPTRRINAVSRKDLQDFHARYFHPDYTYLVVMGDFDTQAMVAKIEAVFPLEAPTVPRTAAAAPSIDDVLNRARSNVTEEELDTYQRAK